MTITILQLDTQWAAPQANILRAEELMGGLSADLFVLPEMWATGFAIEPQGLAENEQTSDALAWMRQTAKVRQCAICGSLAVRTADGSYRNRHYFVTPQGERHYDKRHLFTHGHEHESYQPGNEQVVVEWQGMRFLLLTCYDLRFPVWSRYGRAGLYDGIIVVACWPEKRRDAWDILLRARAIENQCYVIAANRVGDDPVSHYNGGSQIIDPIGRIIAKANENAEQPLMAELSIEEIQKRRSHFRVLDDRDV